MVYWTVLLTAAAGVLAIYYFFCRNVNPFKDTGIPQIRPLPIMGNMLPIIFRQKSMAHVVKDIYNLNKEARYVGIHDFKTPVVGIRDPELIKLVGVKHFEHFMDHRTFADENQDPLFGKNLFSLHGETWKDMRTLLSPAFTSSKMKAMFKLMSECADTFAEYWVNEPAESDCIETKDAFTRYTNDVIGTCAFGIKVDSLRDRTNDFYVLGKEATTFTPFRSLLFFFTRSFPKLCKFLGIRLFSQKVTDFFTNVIETTIRTRDEKNISRPDMIQLMMESRGKRGDKELSIMDMTAQAFIFFFGGFDTTSTLMCFAAHEIAVNPDIQEKLQAEIDEVWKETNGVLTYEALNNMKYLDALINETLRYYPVAVFIDRKCVKDFELPPSLPGGKPYVITKGNYVWFLIYGLHMDPDYFAEPEKFNPDRFLDGNKEDINMSAYMPFGIGPRMCIGNRFALIETKVLLFHLLLRCNFKPCAKTPMPLVLTRKTLTMAPENGFWIKIKPRSSGPTTSQKLSNGHTTAN